MSKALYGCQGPEDVHSIPALRQAQIMRPGYAIEYDSGLPGDKCLAGTKRIEGRSRQPDSSTSGYEEAAARGLIAGINAALKVQGHPRLCSIRRTLGCLSTTW
jgi:tRNA uridine 5-carboxymethylaminomethyl modification enzyme